MNEESETLCYLVCLFTLEKQMTKFNIFISTPVLVDTYGAHAQNKSTWGNNPTPRGMATCKRKI